MNTSPDAVAITTRGLTRRFGDVLAVDHVDLDVPSAGIYGFLGPNGSGKSTTLRMMCGLLAPTSGTVTVYGLDATRESERVRRGLGYMTQGFSLWQDLSVRENLRFVAQVYGLDTRAALARITALESEYRLTEFAKRRAGSLSGGQRQRLALAAATLHGPRLLLLDEPTSAVDPESRRDFWESLFALVDGGTTILVSTHYMDEAERCHRIAILDRGRLVAEGTPEELAARIPADVLEVAAPSLPDVRRALSGLSGLRSMAQLGTRLHVLLDPHDGDPAKPVQQALAAAGVPAEVRRVEANLEDVFVEATRDGAASRAAA